MLLSNNIDAVFQTQLLNQAGSFWVKRIKPRSQVLALMGLANQTKIFGDLRNVLNGYAGEDKDPEQFVILKFNPKSIVRTGSLTYDSLTDPQQYQDSTTAQVVYNRRNLDYYALPITSHIPRSINSTQGVLVLGMDYFVTSDFLMFRQDPRLLFPKSAMHCPLADRVDPVSPWDYLLRATVPENKKYVIQYYKNKQSPEAFRLALAAVAGLAITSYDQKLIAVRTQGDVTIYTFEKESLRTNYPHTQLTVGTTYPAYTIVGNGIQFFRDDGSGNKDWWRKIDWRGGFDLTPFIRQFPGLFLVDGPTTLYSAGSDTGSVNGSKLHVRIKLSEDFYGEKPYWDWVGKQESRSGYYLNNAARAGLPDDTTGKTFSQLVTQYAEANALNAQYNWPQEQPDVESIPNSKTVNALDFFFSTVWQKRALVILIDHTQIANQTQFYTFLQREMLTGIMPIVMSYGAEALVEAAKLGTTFSVSESVKLTSGGYVTVTESNVLSAIMLDTVSTP